MIYPDALEAIPLNSSYTDPTVTPWNEELARTMGKQYQRGLSCETDTPSW